MDIITLIFMGLAVFVGWQLWSILGQTTGHEKPPRTPMGPPPTQEQIPANENRRPADDPVGLSDLPINRWAGFAAAGSEQEDGLNAIARIEDDFNVAVFVEGAKAAYEMIVVAFARGDRQTLKEFVAKDVFESFDQVLKEREQNGERAENTFVSIDKAKISRVEVTDKTAFITVAFQSKMISYVQDQEGRIIEGNPGEVVDVADVWTFSRRLAQRDPNWSLVATEEGDSDQPDA